MFFRLTPDQILPKLLTLLPIDPLKRKMAAMMGPYRHIWLIHPDTVEPLLTSNVHITKSVDYKYYSMEIRRRPTCTRLDL